MRETIPRGWVETTLGAVTQEENNRVGLRDGVRVLSSTKHHGLVPSDEYFKNRTIFSSDTSNYKMVRKGDFAYATNHLAEGSIGLQERFGEACVSPIYTVFSCNDDVYEPYLFRVLKDERVLSHYKLYEQASVDRRGSIRYGDFSRIPFLLPPIAEQRRIAETLSTVDTSIQAAEHLVAKHEAARGGVLDDLFSERGSWPQDALKFFLAASPKNGFSPSEVDDWTGVRVLGLGCLTADGFAPRQLKNVPPSCLGVSSALLEEGDLLMTRANTRELVGFVGRYHEVGGPCLYPDLMMRLRPNKKITPSFLEYSLRHSYMRRQIMAHAVGTSESMVKISSAIVKNLRVAVPPLEEQRRIVSIIEAHDERIAAERVRLEKLRQLKAGLMDDLLTGRVRVDQLQDLPV